MSTYNISQSTLWIVGGFLLATLALGLYAGRGIKDIKDYALGNTRFSTITLVLTFLATDIGGVSIFGAAEDIYKVGIISFLATIGFSIQNLLFGIFIGPKIKNFRNCLTIGDLMNKLYGKNIKILTGILTLLLSIFILSIQLSMLGNAIEYCIGIKSHKVIIIIGTILALYSTIGGIKSVTYTDVIQFIVLIIAIPLILTLVLKKSGGYKNIFYNVPKEKFLIFSNPKFYFYLSFFLIWGIIPINLTIPPLMQRVFMSGSKTQVRHQFYTITILDFIFRIIILIIAFSTLILFKNIDSKNIIPFIIKNFMKSNISKGIAISGIIAILMSTADSYLHSLGLVFSHDIFNSLFKKTKFNELKVCKYSTMIFAFIAIIISLNPIYFLNINGLAMKITGPVLLAPLLLGILGLKTDKKSLYLGICFGLSTLLIFEFNLPKSMTMLAIPFGIIANAITYMISHIIQHKGIAWVKVQGDKQQKPNVWIPNSKKILSFLINLIPTPKSIYKYSKDQVMKNGAQNILFGIYACINFTIVHYLWDHHDPYKYNLMITLRFIGGVMAALLIVKDKWYDSLKPYFSLYWHLTLTYCLPFITTVMFLLSDGSFYWLNSIAVSIFFLIMLVAGEVFLILAPLGVGLGLIFYKYYFGPVNLSTFSFELNFNLFSQILFPTIIGLLFAFNKRISNILKGNIGLNLGSALCHEIKNTLYSLTCNQFNRARMKVIVDNNTQKVDGKDFYLVNKELFISFLHQTNEAINFDEDTLKVVRTFEKIFKDYKKELSNPKVYSISSVVNFTLNELHFLPGQKEKVKLKLDDDFYAKIPKSPFAFVISNIIRNAFKHGRASEVLIKLENHRLIIRDNGVGVPFENLERIFKMHYTTGQRDSTGIGLGFAKLIVNSCFGEIWCESNQGENSYSEFIIQFPVVSPSDVIKSTLSQMQEDIKINTTLSERELIATRMLMHNEPIDKIQSYTQLSKSEIIEIERNI